MNLFGDPTIWLPFVFASLMGASILIYVILDGFDLGVGLLFPFAEDSQKDRMVASIGPFWDANETWLVLAIGLLLVAFPTAHGTILTALYLPVAVLLVGLILRGVSFEFRAKAPMHQKYLWNRAFFIGSLMTSTSQGFMLGLYIMGLEMTPATLAFATLTAACLTVGYSAIGAAWLIIKASGKLQLKAVAWTKRGLLGVVIGMIAVSVATPFTSTRIFDKWFSTPEIFLLAPVPLMSAAVVIGLWIMLSHLPKYDDRHNWVPFAGLMLLNAMAYFGLAYSFYPYIVPQKLTIYEAASAPESLLIILVGTLFVFPVILAYTALAYYIFRGKARDLTYD